MGEDLSLPLRDLKYHEFVLFSVSCLSPFNISVNLNLCLLFNFHHRVLDPKSFYLDCRLKSLFFFNLRHSNQYFDNVNVTFLHSCPRSWNPFKNYNRSIIWSTICRLRTYKDQYLSTFHTLLSKINKNEPT